MTRQEMLDAIGSLYTSEFGDIKLSVSLILTEPVCPTATIVFEESEVEGGDQADYPYFRADEGTIDESIDAVVRLAYEGLVNRNANANSFLGLPDSAQKDGLISFWAAVDKKKP